jgi:5-formyltetrahydrofolate cyclo-ligase
MDKAELRRQMQQVLRAMPESKRKEKSKLACRNLIETSQFDGASTVMIYLSLPHEVDTSEVILRAWQLGKTVAVPKISWQQRHMIPVCINSLETDFQMNSIGLRNPVTGIPASFEEIDLVVTPGLAFDQKGNRLGRGGSYYDRFFANEKLTASRCGFAFIEQVIDEVPVTQNDLPVDFIVTDEGLISCNNRNGV